MLVATTLQSPNGHCNGSPTSDQSCCSTSNNCDLGGGECDDDLQCNGILNVVTMIVQETSAESSPTD